MPIIDSASVYSAAIAIIEFLGALLIVGYALAALVALVTRRALVQARLLVAEGVLWGLNFKLAGSLLKTIAIHTWQQIVFFAIIFALRTLVKRVFTWEQTRLLAERARLAR